jgi:hypothetical protein
VDPYIYSANTESSSDASTDIAPEWEYRPLTGSFPDDSCHPEALPIIEGTDEGDRAITLLNQRYPGLQTAIVEASPVAATWMNGDTASVSIELGALTTLDPLCTFGVGGLTFTSTARIKSDESRLDLTTKVEGAIVIDPLFPSVTTVQLSWSHYFSPQDPFWATSLPAVDRQGVSSTRVILNARYKIVDRQANAAGSLSIYALRGCEPYSSCADATLDAFWNAPLDGLTWPLP